MIGVVDRGVHVAVLLGQVLDLLRPEHARLFLDVTLGAAGHARAMMERAGEGARLVGVDRDGEILAIAEGNLADHGDRVHLHRAPFQRFDRALKEAAFGAPDRILADLGVSSLQLDRAERGFSFRHDGPLDMRMNARSGPTARELLETLPEEELARILHEYGEEPSSRRIAKRLVELRRRRAPRTTAELARFIESLRPTRPKGRSAIHPATKVFQALRIAVNDELGMLERTLPRLIDALAPGGRIGVISFHSLEDRIVKRIFRDRAGEPGWALVTRKPVEAEAAEIAENPRARSARLRVLSREEASDA